VFVADRLALDCHRKKRDPERRAWIINRECFNADVAYVDPQLLAKFAADRVSIGLAGFTFSTRKLPKASVPFVRRALTNEEAIISCDYGSNYTDRISRHVLKMPVRPSAR
jgi:hypothetical protein